jgi:hypothetical protein
MRSYRLTTTPTRSATLAARATRPHDRLSRSSRGLLNDQGWLRHYAGARVEEVGTRACKQRFLGHKPHNVTDRYGKASFANVAWCVQEITREPHPLAEPPPGRG